jgi:hypothetical protein
MSLVRSLLVLALVAVVWQGCGRNGLDDPIDLTGGAGTTGQAGTTGRAGTTGQAGTTGRAGTSGQAGTTGQAGATGLAGTTGRAGTTGSAGTIGMAGMTGTAAVGGQGAVTGQAGSGPMTCVPGQSVACGCSNGAQGAQVCGPMGTFGDCVCGGSPEFDRLRKEMIGQWIGTETTRFTSPYKVMITFGADGHYSAHCLTGSMCPDPVFYYGSDDDDPSKTYELVDLRANGTGSGTIQIFFFPGDVTQGSLEAVTISPDGNHLQFEFWETWNGRVGPFVFDLFRQPGL